MSAGVKLRLEGRWAGVSASQRRWLLLSGLWALAVLGSAVQIYLREMARGTTPPWGAVLMANVLAWLPWLLLAVPILRLERRFPLAGTASWRHCLLHLLAAAVLAATFLLFLALFHLVYLEGEPLPPSPAVLRAEYVEKLGRFFLTSVGLYGVIAVAGFAERTWREHRRARAVRRRSTGAVTEPIIVRSTGRLERIDPETVRWVSADGNYSRLHIDDRSVLHRRSLTALADQLEGERFVRVHRSHLVNLRYVHRLERRSHGDGLLVLDDGSRLKVSRTYRQALKAHGF